MNLIRENIDAACDCAARMRRLVIGKSAMSVEDPCADERAVVELAVQVRDTAAAALSLAEAALSLAEMALMDCEANNSG